MSGDAAVSFLATQGDVWDTQWDMFLAFISAIAALLLFGRLHDRSMQRAIGFGREAALDERKQKQNDPCGREELEAEKQRDEDAKGNDQVSAL
jgi:hypothetical protein